MASLTDPVQTGDQLYLRDVGGNDRLWRLPQPPALLPGAAGGTLVKFRKPLDELRPGDERPDDSAGGILSLAFDIGPVQGVAAGSEVELNRLENPPREVRPIPVRGGSLSLFLGGLEILTAVVPTSTRPTVPCCGLLSREAATLLDRASREQMALSATCALQVAVQYQGPRFILEIDGDKAAVVLGGSGTGYKLAELRGQVERLIESGIVRIVTRAPQTPEMMTLCELLAIGGLFEPMPGGRPWSAIPGLGAPTNGGVRVAGPRGLASRIEIEGGLAAAVEVEVPCFAGAPIHLGNEAQLADLPESRVQCLSVRMHEAEPTDVRQVDLQLPDGTEASVRFARDEVESKVRTIRYALPEDGSRTYRYRVDGGEWLSTRHTVLVIAP